MLVLVGLFSTATFAGTAGDISANMGGSQVREGTSSANLNVKASQVGSTKHIKDIRYKQLETIQRYYNPKCDADAKAELAFVLKEFESTKLSCSSRKDENCFSLTDGLDIEKLVNELSTQDLPTPCESALTYSLLSNLVKRLEDGIPKSREIQGRFPIFGTVSSNEPNAMAVPGETEDSYLVVFNREMFVFVHEFTKLYFQSFGYKKTDKHVGYSWERAELEKRLKEQPEITKTLATVTLRLVVGGESPHNATVKIDARYADLIPRLVESVELFALAHEYAHVFLRHKRNNDRVANVGGVSVFNRSEENEVEADILGHLMHITVIGENASDPIASAFEIWGADMLFTMIEIIEDAKTIVSQQRAEAASHPPAQLRRAMIRANIDRMREKNKTFASFDFGRAFHDVAEFLWANSRAQFVSMYQAQASNASKPKNSVSLGRCPSCADDKTSVLDGRNNTSSK
jgi:hypothetical protein